MYKVTAQERATAMATSRNRGAVGANAIVPRAVRQWASQDDSVLDFGCGKDAAHAQALTADGYKVAAYDFHLADCGDVLAHQYALVYASNVLNVQDSVPMMHATLRQMWACVQPGGSMIVNLPTSPRKGAYAGLTILQGVEQLYNALKALPGQQWDTSMAPLPKRIAGTGSAPVFRIIKDTLSN